MFWTTAHSWEPNVSVLFSCVGSKVIAFNSLIIGESTGSPSPNNPAPLPPAMLYA